MELEYSIESDFHLPRTLREKSVPFLSAGSPEFEGLLKPYNQAFAFEPAAVVIPKTPKHISDAVLIAGAGGKKVQARSGGHSYGSYSLGGRDDSVIIDLRNFDDIVLNNSTGIAVVGAGVRLGALAARLYELGKRALPHGTIPGVGIGGQFSHGGFGYESRAWGLGMDTIVALDAVLADGSLILASAKQNEQAFYALRGAADSFGIITHFHLQTNPAPATTVVFSFDIENLLRSPRDAVKVFLNIQAWSQNLQLIDRRTTFGLYLHDGIFRIWGKYMGDIRDFEQKIEPELLRHVDYPLTRMVKAMTWLDSMSYFAGMEGKKSQDTFYAQSVLIRESDPLSEKALMNYFEFLVNNDLEDSQAWYAVINLWGGTDSQINVRDIDYAAYSHRNILWAFQHIGFSRNHEPPLEKSTVVFINELGRTLKSSQPSMDFGAEINYVDPHMSREEAHKAYFGDELTQRLKKIKDELDPNDIFHNPQSIGSRTGAG